MAVGQRRLGAGLARDGRALVALTHARPRGLPPRGRAERVDAKPALRKVLRDLDSRVRRQRPGCGARCACSRYAEARFAPSPPRSLGALAALLPEPVAREVLALEAHIYGAAAGVWRGDGLKTGCGELEGAGLGRPSRRGRAVAAAVSMRNQSRL